MVIVGAGYTGLWTAYYLAKADPSLRIVVLEAQTAGFGASGRNGGWCSALFPVSSRRLASLPGSSREAAIELHRAMQATVNEVGLVIRRRGDRLRLPQGRDDRAGPHAGPARPRSRRGGSRARVGTWRPPVPGAGRGRRAGAGDKGAGGNIHAALRGDPSGQAGARTRRRGRTARRDDPRAHSGAHDRARSRDHVVRRGAGGGRGPGDRGVHAGAGRGVSGGGAGVLADGRDRAARSARCGSGSGWRIGRRSATTGT